MLLQCGSLTSVFGIRKSDETFATLQPVTHAPAVWIERVEHLHFGVPRSFGVTVSLTQRDYLILCYFALICSILAFPGVVSGVLQNYGRNSLPGFLEYAFSAKEIAKSREIFGKSFMIGIPIVV